MYRQEILMRIHKHVPTNTHILFYKPAVYEKGYKNKKKFEMDRQWKFRAVLVLLYILDAQQTCPFSKGDNYLLSAYSANIFWLNPVCMNGKFAFMIF